MTLDGDIYFRAGCPQVPPCLCYCLPVGLRICSHLQQEEASLMVAKQGIDLWAKEIVLRTHFIATCVLVKVGNRFLCVTHCVKVSVI